MKTTMYELNQKELSILQQALNEILHGPDAIEEFEFITRMGADKIVANNLLEKLNTINGTQQQLKIGLRDKQGAVSEIEQWIIAIKELHKNRTLNDYNILFDIHPVENFDVMLLGEQKKTEKEIKDGYANMFEKFCKRIVDTARFERESGRVSDELSSVSSTLYLVDWGYSIYSEIISGFSKDEKRSRLDNSENIYKALDIIAGKRLAMARIIDPFDLVRLNIKYDEEEKFKDYPFQVFFDQEFDWDAVDIRICFNKIPEDKSMIINLIESWSINEKNEGNILSITEKSLWNWNEDNKFVEFTAYMNGLRYVSLQNLFNAISQIKEIDEVKIGSGYQSWEADESLEKVVVTIKGIDLDKNNPQQIIEKLEASINKRPHLKNLDIIFDETKDAFVVRVEASYLIGESYVREEILDIASPYTGNYEM